MNINDLRILKGATVKVGIPIKTTVTTYPLEQVNQALDDLRHGRFAGAAVIDIAKRPFGVLKGKINISKDFDEPLPDELLADFES